jgi:hypothetical protein
MKRSQSRSALVLWILGCACAFSTLSVHAEEQLDPDQEQALHEKAKEARKDKLDEEFIMDAVDNVAPDDPMFPNKLDNDALKRQLAVMAGDGAVLWWTQRQIKKNAGKNDTSDLDEMVKRRKAELDEIKQQPVVDTSSLEREKDALFKKREQVLAAMGKKKGDATSLQKELDQVNQEIRDFENNRVSRLEKLFADRKVAYGNELTEELARLSGKDDAASKARIKYLQDEKEKLEHSKLGQGLVTDVEHEKALLRAESEYHAADLLRSQAKNGEFKVKRWVLNRGVGKTLIQGYVVYDMIGRAYIMITQNKDPELGPVIVPVGRALEGGNKEKAYRAAALKLVQDHDLGFKAELDSKGGELKQKVDARDKTIEVLSDQISKLQDQLDQLEAKQDDGTIVSDANDRNQQTRMKNTDDFELNDEGASSHEGNANHVAPPDSQPTAKPTSPALNTAG